MKKTLFAAALALLAAQAGAAALFADAIATPPQGQSLALVEKASRAAQALALTRHADGSGPVVAHLPAGSPLVVLLADAQGRHLVKTPFGLTGWAQIDEGKDGNAPALVDLKGLKKAAFGDNSGSFTAYYNPAAIEFINQKLENEGEPTIFAALRGRFAGDSDVYLMECDGGPSADPSCTFRLASTSMDDAPQDNTLNGETFYLPGNGLIYSDTSANLFYRTRAKWTLKAGRVAEVEQPFFYIGVNSRAQNAFSLQGLDGQRHAVKKGEKVRVVLDDPHCDLAALKAQKKDDDSDPACPMKLLARGASGASGWVTIEPFGGDDAGKPRIKDIYFHGD